MNTARLKAWIGYTLAVEEVERRLGLSWGAAQKALLEACERGELRWRNTPGGGPDIGIAEGRSVVWPLAEIAKIAKPTVEISDKVRLNLEKFVWSSREK